MDARVTFTLHELVHELDRQADGILRRALGITYSQFLFLACLESGPLEAARLAERLGVSRAAVSQRLDWFAQRELAIVSRDGTRSVRIELSERGRTLLGQASNLLESTMHEVIGSNSAIDLAELNETLHHLLETVRNNPRS